MPGGCRGGIFRLPSTQIGAVDGSMVRPSNGTSTFVPSIFCLSSGMSRGCRPRRIPRPFSVKFFFGHSASSLLANISDLVEDLDQCQRPRACRSALGGKKPGNRWEILRRSMQRAITVPLPFRLTAIGSASGSVGALVVLSRRSARASAWSRRSPNVLAAELGPGQHPNWPRFRWPSEGSSLTWRNPCRCVRACIRAR